jgi:arylsulfatase B
LLLIADDLGVDATSFYPLGVRKATTPPPPPMPNLQALADEGVIFSRVWADPWCSPTRATILTGRYGFRTGIGRANSGNLPPLPLSEFTLPEAFQAAGGTGYDVASFGKWHLSSGAGDPNLHGWPHYAGGHPDLGKLPSYYSWPKTVDGVTATSTVYATTDTVDEALKLIEAPRSPDQRYFAWVGFNAPHDPYEPPPEGLHSKGPLPPTGAAKRTYFEAMVEALDSEIGRLLRSVDLATTTVIFVGDNGTSSGVIARPYPRAKAKGTVYEGGVRVPLLIAGAGVANKGRIVTKLVNTVDLFPTVLQLAGIDPAIIVPGGVRTDGVTLLPYLQDKPHPKPRGWIFAEQFTTRFDTSWERTVRNGRYALIERADGSREFHDLSTDRFQATNLLAGALNSEQRTNLASLDRILDKLIASR